MSGIRRPAQRFCGSLSSARFKLAERARAGLAGWRGLAGSDTPLPRMRQYDADGVSAEARAVIARHGLDMGRVLEWAHWYAEKRGPDFNLAPLKDFGGSPLGKTLTKISAEMRPFGLVQERFNSALDSFDYGVSDSIMDKLLRDGSVVDKDGRSIYSGGGWTQSGWRGRTWPSSGLPGMPPTCAGSC